MKIVIAEKAYEVDVNPLRETAAKALRELVHDKQDGNDTLRFMVKQACVYAKGKLGLKGDRNTDPIELVIGHLASQLFDYIENQGLTLQGAEAVEEESGNVNQD
jgi:hypothetical protein